MVTVLTVLLFTKNRVHAFDARLGLFDIPGTVGTMH